jgi:hypothetical protein
MPFTPFHMGPGILIKALLQGGFSLMVFGWTQIVMDVQPLVAIVTGEGKLHGFTHTYVGATLIAGFSALTGKYLSQWGLVLLSDGARRGIDVRWRVAFLSAFVGAYTHVVLDGVMHADIEPLDPFSHAKPLWGVISVTTLHQFCLYSGLVGTGLYFAVAYRLSRRSNQFDAGAPGRGAG